MKYPPFILGLLISGALAAQDITPSQQQLLADSRSGVYFRENKGQVKDQHGQPRQDVLYSGEVNGLVYHLKKDGLHYQLNRVASRHEPDNERPDWFLKPVRSEVVHDEIDIYRVDVTWLNTTPDVQIETGRELPGYENFYNVPEGVPPALFVKKFAGVTYRRLYPGVDLHFFEGPGGGLEYDFIVHPGADYRKIQLEITGAGLRLSPNNELLIETPFGTITEGALKVYQEDRELEARWKVRDNRVFFDIAGRDPAKPLRIDPPVRIWGTYYGGDGFDYGFSCATDGSGHVLLAGRTTSTTDIATSGAHQTTYGGGATWGDAFLVKFDSSGVRQWGTYYGGSGDDWADACDTDDNGNVFLTGTTESTTSIATSGAHQENHGGGFFDAFLVKFDGNGIRQWGTYYGGDNTEFGTSTTTDTAGNVFMAGYTSSDTSIASAGAHQSVLGGGSDAFLVKFNGSGVRQWGTYYGGNNQDFAASCFADDKGNLFLTGSTESDTSIATPGAHQEIRGGNRDAFLVKFNNTGVRQWGTYYGGSAGEIGWDTYAVDGDVFLAGNTTSDTAIATSGAYQTTYGGSSTWDTWGDAFLIKFDNSGVRQWGTYYGGADNDRFRSCEVGSDGKVLLAGETASDSGIATVGAHQTFFGGGVTDAMLVQFDSSGNRQWGTYYGGTGDDHGLGCAINNGHVFVAGYTNSTDSIATPGAHQDSLKNGDAAFLVKFDPCATAATITPEFCDTSGVSYTSPSGNYTWTTSGAYQDTIPNAAGCDSIITVHLTIDSSSTATIAPTTCDTYNSPSGNYTWASSGIYMDTLPNQAGCDSIITINLTIDSSSTATISPVSCDSFISPSGNYTWTSSGTYSDTIPNTTGCDSLITINLSIDSSRNTYISPAACDSYTSPSGNYTWTSTGTYMDTISTQAGCDSLLTINLTISTVDTSVTHIDTTLTANVPSATYQWLDCDNNHAPITGATNQSFTPASNGNYAVEVIQNGCTDTSACYHITGVGMAFLSQAATFQIYPNPGNGAFTLSWDEPAGAARVTVTNVLGQTVYQAKVTQKQHQITLDVTQGMYFVRVQMEETAYIARIVVTE